MPTVKTGGSEIYYEELGEGDPLVMTPGLGAHSGVWGPFPQVFAEKRRVVTHDPRGLGRSTAGGEDLSLELMASDVKAVMDAAGIEKAALLGVSMGALIVLRLALDYPGAVSKLVLVTPGAIRTRYTQWLFQSLQLVRERLAPGEYVRLMGALAFAPPFFERGYGMIKEVLKMLTPTESEYEQIGRQLACLIDADISSELSRIEAPALIIAGERDALVPIEAARRLASKLRGSRLYTLPNAGHSPFVEATEEVLAVIEEFL